MAGRETGYLQAVRAGAYIVALVGMYLRNLTLILLWLWQEKGVKSARNSPSNLLFILNICSLYGLLCHVLCVIVLVPIIVLPTLFELSIRLDQLHRPQA